MNKNEAMVERLKGKEVSKCGCGSYMVGEYSVEDSWTEFRCKMCEYNTLRVKGRKDIRYPQLNSEEFYKQNESMRPKTTKNSKVYKEYKTKNIRWK